MSNARYLLISRTKAALEKSEARFPEKHAGDTDGQLLEYLKSCADKIGRSPNRCEVVGGRYIAQRFGSWEAALERLGLPEPCPAPLPEHRLIFREEARRQQKILQDNMRQKRKLREKGARETREKISGEELARRKEEFKRREKEFAGLHADDTDEQLLAYLRLCAQELGHSPFKREVVGGELIKKRFVQWSIALWQAGLPMARGLKPPTEKEKRQFENGSLRRAREAKERRALEKL